MGFVRYPRTLQMHEVRRTMNKSAIKNELRYWNGARDFDKCISLYAFRISM
jgi:hypothetical protein